MIARDLVLRSRTVTARTRSPSHIGRDRLVLEQHEQPSRSRHTGRALPSRRPGRLAARGRASKRAVAGVEELGRSGLGGHAGNGGGNSRECPAGAPGRTRSAELLDPRVLVGRHGLGGELAADPVGRLGENDGRDRLATPPEPRHSRPAHRRRSTTSAATSRGRDAAGHPARAIPPVDKAAQSPPSPHKDPSRNRRRFMERSNLLACWGCLLP